MELKTYLIADCRRAQAQMLCSGHDWAKGEVEAIPYRRVKRTQFFFESIVPERVKERIYQRVQAKTSDRKPAAHCKKRAHARERSDHVE